VDYLLTYPTIPFLAYTDIMSLSLDEEANFEIPANGDLAL
jgi:hypothetical protein